MTRLRVADSVISREIGGTLIVLDVQRGAYFQLDRTAAAIWRSIETLGRFERVVDECASAFGDDAARIQHDARQFVGDALAWGLLLEDSGERCATPSAPPFDGDAPLSVGRAAIQITADLDELKRRFAEQPYLELPRFVAHDLLSLVHRALECGDFADRVHPGIGTELCLTWGAAAQACQLLFNDLALLNAVTYIAGCAPLRCFDGRVYRLDPESAHYDSWHSDAAHDRVVGLSVNLSPEPYEGGVLEIRRAVAAEAEHAVASAGFGNAILFRISPDFRHRVTEVRGTRPRTAYAGWFRTFPDFAGTFLDALTRRSVAVAR